ncbi:hypothetical protein ACFTZB_35965 [Rhodococcus sp. NPDC057014]
MPAPVSSPVEAATKAEALFLSLRTPAIVEGVVAEVLARWGVPR